jgi:UDP-N-acetylmuramoyl-tripeptide--D-alanyl-D-alanine ligase
MFKNHIQKKLEKYVQKYFLKHPEVKLVAVSGSVGKTSTKIAIGTILSQKFRVRMEMTNHNTPMSAPLAVLGIAYPENIRSPFAWMRVFKAARKRIKDPTDVDVIVQELGIDRVGEMAQFARYLKPDIGLVTAVAPEHMEFLHNIETVAEEEIMLANISELALINRDDIEGRFAELITDSRISTYGTSGAAEYRVEIEDFSIGEGYTCKLIFPELQSETIAKIKVLGEHNLRPVVAGMAVAIQLGMDMQSIVTGIEAVRPVAGRMNIIKGMDDSVLIDDSYNSSPSSAEAALQALYQLDAPQRIAILGDMNELGVVSAAEHEKLGSLCDPDLLDWVITVGRESEKYLAPAARQRGCQVKSFNSAIDAGSFAHSVLKSQAIVLAKGSQDGVFLEEALKILLHSISDDSKLVRQDDRWKRRKDDLFQKI